MKKRAVKSPAKAIKSTKTTNNDDSAILHNQLTLIEVAEPELLAELQADHRIGPLIVTRLSDRVAVVAVGKANLILKHLLKAGHTPKNRSDSEIIKGN
jgi:hypothetical protein